jgi:phosphatidylserine/phosphatidylglycerophosphate/cardiolipin synthase-like enzyme/uncharacterized membrane protein YdjX (TVP38/TMEM64 family)
LQLSTTHTDIKQAQSLQKSIFKPGRNCWRVRNATFAAPVIDCSNYYRAVHQAICNARHTLFIVGWDIDSRIELIRGKEAESAQCPNTLYELLKWKSEITPDLKMYLNRWDYSIFLAAERESFASMKWQLNGIENLEFIFDDQLPLGASHHQKIIVVDDEIAFCGGMDIAIARWDNRQHHVKEKDRKDPKGTLFFGIEDKYKPYHDVQMVVAGDAAQSLGELARKRWFYATGRRAKAVKPEHTNTLPDAWPTSITPAFENVELGIALTAPRFRNQKLNRGIERLYLDLIAQAEHFIYMENQYFSHVEIAHALNKRLLEKPELRVLMISCKDPQGIMERKSMYHGRVKFKDALTKNGVTDRTVLAYPISTEKNKQEQIRIHSKVMIVDDRYLRIGSSNINYRSMTLDTECDLVIEGTDKKVSQSIAAIRNDLIREHTGRSVKEIDRIINEGESVQAFLKDVAGSRQHLRETQDEIYRKEPFARIFTRFADPSKPLLPSYLTAYRKVIKKNKLKKPIPFKLVAAVALILVLLLAWKFTPLSEYADAKTIAALFADVRNTVWAIPLGILAYALGTLAFLPHIVMTTAAVIIFPPVEAIFVAITGSLLNCTISYVLGMTLGKESLNALFGKYSDKIHYYADKGGLLGLTTLRLVPVAPFTVVNLILGMIKVPYSTMMLSTFLALLPGTMIFAFIGKAALDLFENPEPEKWVITITGVAAWIALIWFTHYLTSRWKKKF